MHERDRAILRYLDQADSTPGLERWVTLFQEATMGDPYDSLRQEYEDGQEVAPDAWLRCKWLDVQSLIEAGYVEGTIVATRLLHRVRISRKGKALVQGAFVEPPDEPKGVQINNFHADKIGNVAVAHQGSARIAGSGVSQGSSSPAPGSPPGAPNVPASPPRPRRPLPGTESWNAAEERVRRHFDSRPHQLLSQPGSTPLILPPGPRLAAFMVPWWGRDTAPDFSTLAPEVAAILEGAWGEPWDCDVRRDSLVLAPQAVMHGQVTAYMEVRASGVMEGAVRGASGGIDAKARRIDGALCGATLLRFLRAQLAIARLLGLHPPFGVRLGLLAVDGFMLDGAPPAWRLREGYNLMSSQMYLLQAHIDRWEESPEEDILGQLWWSGNYRKDGA